MNIKLTNGKKTITRTKEQYEVNINHFTDSQKNRETTEKKNVNNLRNARNTSKTKKFVKPKMSS